MIKLIPIKIAYFLSMFLFILFLLFHIFIIVGIVYFNLNLTNYLWGGQIKTNPELIQFEMISILVQSLCTIIVYFRIRIEKFSKYKKILNLFIWILFLIFLLNTIGNLYANSFYEKIIFTPITLLLSLLMFRIAIEKD